MRSNIVSFFRHLMTALIAFLGFGLCLSCLSAVEQRLGLVGKEDHLVYVRAPISIPHIEENLSGLTWNPATGTLFATPASISQFSPSPRTTLVVLGKKSCHAASLYTALSNNPTPPIRTPCLGALRAERKSGRFRMITAPQPEAKTI